MSFSFWKSHTLLHFLFKMKEMGVIAGSIPQTEKNLLGIPVVFSVLSDRGNSEVTCYELCV